MKRIIIFLLVCIISYPLSAQRGLEKKLSGVVNPDELVTLSASIPFDQAVEILSEVSQKISGKRIVTIAGFTEPIGIEILSQPYLRAMTVMVQYNNLMFEEKEEVIIIKRKSDVTQTLTPDIYAPVTEREVKITGLFFEANASEMNEKGINWQFLLSQGGLSIGSEILSFSEEKEQTEATTTTSMQATPEFTIGVNSEFTLGGFDGTAEGLFKFFETENLGEIIARPSIIVRDKNQGRIQIGSDISIKERDFAGNIIDRFYATGTIIEVTPYIYSEEGVDYVLLKLRTERSSAEPDVVSTEIRKTQASTEVLMLDGEEIVIGGLYVNEELTVRRGIPILKDLPWWFFGIRYLAGYDQVSVNKKEIIILIKAEIIPTLKERIAQKKEGNLIKDQLAEDEAEINKYRLKPLTKDQDEEEPEERN